MTKLTLCASLAVLGLGCQTSPHSSVACSAPNPSSGACETSAQPPASCSAPIPASGAVPTLEADQGELATSLLAPLSQQAGGGNLAFSPFGVSAIVDWAYASMPVSPTDPEARALGLTVSTVDAPAAFADIDCRLVTDGQSDGNQLTVANAIFLLAPGTPPSTSEVDADFGMMVQTVQGDPVTVVNGWASRQTNGLVPTLLQPGDLSGATDQVDVDVVSFKGEWASAFPASATQTGSFTTAASTQLQVPLMAQTNQFGYAHPQGFAIVELPYQGQQLALDIVLPDAVSGLPQLRSSFTAQAFAGWVAGLSPTSVAVTLPRFTVQSRLDLEPALVTLGVPAADLFGLHVDSFVQQTVVEVDESGTVAAAATELATEPTAVISPTAFEATHPFLFVLRDLPTGTILFVGELSDPS